MKYTSMVALLFFVGLTAFAAPAGKKDPNETRVASLILKVKNKTDTDLQVAVTSVFGADSKTITDGHAAYYYPNQGQKLITVFDRYDKTSYDVLDLALTENTLLVIEKIAGKYVFKIAPLDHDGKESEAAEKEVKSLRK